jgi:hypothetical protein
MKLLRLHSQNLLLHGIHGGASRRYKQQKKPQPVRENLFWVVDFLKKLRSS